MSMIYNITSNEGKKTDHRKKQKTCKKPNSTNVFATTLEP